MEPTQEPTQEPTVEPTQEPTQEPTVEPTEEPTEEPTMEPTEEPTDEPVVDPDDDDDDGHKSGDDDDDDEGGEEIIQVFNASNPTPVPTEEIVLPELGPSAIEAVAPAAGGIVFGLDSVLRLIGLAFAGIGFLGMVVVTRFGH